MIEAIFGIIGDVVGSFLTIAKDSFASWRQRKREGSYSAIRLICILHEYADQCVDVVEDDGTIHGEPSGRTESGEECYFVQVRPPTPPEYPDDIEWRSLHESLMHQILGLPNKARATNRYIDRIFAYVADPPGYEEGFQARKEGYARLGHDALHLVEQLSVEYEIPAKHMAGLGDDWDTRNFFAEKISFFDEQRTKARQRCGEAAVDLQPLLGSGNGN